MKLVELKCKNCGSTLQFDENAKEITCEYCKTKYRIENNEKDKEYHLQRYEDYLKYKQQREQLLYKNDQRVSQRTSQRETTKAVQKGCLIAFFSFVALIIISVIIMFIIGIKASAKPEINPFDYIEVQFSGQSGEGRAKVIVKDNDKNFSQDDFSYKFTKGYNLSEGDTTTLTVSGYKFKFTETSKKYTVTGLTQVIKDLNISAKGIELIRKTTYSKIDSYFKYKGKVYTLKKLFLLTNEKDGNILFAATDVSYLNYNNQRKHEYVVMFYNNMIVNDESISFGSSMYVFDGSGHEFKDLNEVKTYIQSHNPQNLKLFERNI